MAKVYYNSLIIEVTRRCNMNCAHCIRGDAQNVDISFETIDKALNNVQSIGDIVFTGGEISLNVPAIKHTLDVCRERGISVSAFYAVTNGKSVSLEFIATMLDWYAYVIDCDGDTEMCALALSSDIFHEKVDPKNIQLLQGLSFFNQKDKAIDWNKSKLTNLGKAKNLLGYKKAEPLYLDEFEVEKENDECFIEEATLTATGDFLRSCNYEYESTDDIKVGSIAEPDWFLKFIA